MNASAAARPGEDDGLEDKRYRRADNWAVLHERQRWQEESQERKQREEVEDEHRHMRQCKIKTLEDMLDTHEKTISADGTLASRA
jgi:L-lactate utilization protein LutB